MISQTKSVDFKPSAHNTDASLVHQLNPLKDPRWQEFVARHPKASVFHSVAWLEALQRTYGYEPVVYTTSGPGEDLQNGIVFCRVESWLTGRRLVSLPFSDHCEPLVERQSDLEALAAALEQETRRENWGYVEVRPLEAYEISTALRHTMVTYHFHHIDLTRPLQTIFESFHRDSTQRKVRRAEREGLRYEEGSSERLLDIFYRLFKMTRSRHHLPPQPRIWFRNLVECFGKDLKIRITFKDERPIAGMITLRHKQTLTYKYGCSDRRFHNLGSMHLLFWRSIQEAKDCGLRSFDLGRTDAGQAGLVTFKNRWGATHSALTYSRYAASGSATHIFDLPTSKWKKWAANYVLSHLQPGLASRLGQLLYKHVG